MNRVGCPAGRSPGLTMALSGASVPRSTTIEAAFENGRSSGLMTSRVAERRRRPGSLADVLPGHGERARVEHRLERSSSASAPPAASKASIVSGPFGATALSTGTRRAELVEEREDVHVDAGLHGRRLQVLDAVDRSADGQHRRPPRFGRRRSSGCRRGFRSSHTISTMRRPERRARSNIFGLLASTGALPGSVMPSASQTMCIELAVPMPAQTPGP